MAPCGIPGPQSVNSDQVWLKLLGKFVARRRMPANTTGSARSHPYREVMLSMRCANWLAGMASKA